MWRDFPELVEQFPASALLGEVRIQDLEPALRPGGIRRAPMFGNDSLQVFVADRPE